MANNNYDFDAFGPDNSADETIHVGWITLQEFFILLAASLSPLCRCDDGWHPVARPNRVFPSSAVERLFVTGILKGFDPDHQDEALEDFDRVGILVTRQSGPQGQRVSRDRQGRKVLGATKVHQARPRQVYTS